ncbi:FHA domain-containing protein [Pleurocapsa sp. PCC 7319]|uniref:FHA domain-containing protein n=1 Tax=Pleurocapsa sp. PCC 7319 TaxID=118161 RepID=UPI00034D053F|nr:FHA domain-containing protein [Pleurocapsa sp. PCC 7319]
MITCPSCNHQNPEGSLQCENCYTPLPATISCPNCGASVQTDATFCGQCGFNLQAENPLTTTSLEETVVGSLPDIDVSLESLEEISVSEEISLSEAQPDILPETAMSSPIQSPWDDDEEEGMTIGQTQFVDNEVPEIESTEVINFASSIPDLDNSDKSHSESVNESQPNTNMPWELDSPDLDESKPAGVALEPEVEIEPLSSSADSAPVQTETSSSPVPEPTFAPVNTMSGATQLQIQRANLLHLQTNTTIEIAPNLDVVHIGKPNGQIPPDIDVAGFPDSEIVSRVHADIRIEGDAYYIEDVGSSNGTYINHAPLLRGNRHRLRPGDRIALGKGDLVTFIFQLN